MSSGESQNNAAYSYSADAAAVRSTRVLRGTRADAAAVRSERVLRGTRADAAAVRSKRANHSA